VEIVVDLSDGAFAWSLSPAPDVTIQTAQLRAGEGLEPATVLEMTLRRVS
jgi:hypothetical protein